MNEVHPDAKFKESIVLKIMILIPPGTSMRPPILSLDICVIFVRNI